MHYTTTITASVREREIKSQRENSRTHVTEMAGEQGNTLLSLDKPIKTLHYARYKHMHTTSCVLQRCRPEAMH